MTFLDLKVASPELRAVVLAVNGEHAEQTSPLTAEQLEGLVAEAALALARPDGRAFVILFGPGASYDSPNYRWFTERAADFLYVDRIVVGQELQGQGVGRALYAEAIKAAAAGGVPLVCEVNSDPPNPGSDAFHAALGFKVIGEARLRPDKAVRYMRLDPA